MITASDLNPKTLAPCRTVAFSSDGKYLLEVNYMGVLSVRCGESGVLISRHLCQTTMAESIRIRPNTNSLFVVGGGFEGGGDFGSVLVFDIPSGKRINQISGHGDDILDICFPSEDSIVTVGFDGASIFHQLESNEKWIYAVDYYLNTCASRPGHEGQYAIGGDGTLVHVLNGIDQNVVARLTVDSDISGVIWSHCGRYLLVGGDDKTVCYFDSTDSWRLCHRKKLGGAIKKMNYDSLSESHCLVASYDGVIWRVPLSPEPSDAPVKVLSMVKNVWGTNVASHGNKVAVPSFGHSAILMQRNEDGIADSLIGEMPKPTFGCNWVDIDASGQILGTSHDDGIIRLRSIENGNWLKNLTPNTDTLLMGFGFHPQIKVLAVVDFSGTLFIMNYEKNIEIDRLQLDFGPGISLSFNKTGEFIAVGGYNEFGYVLTLSKQGEIISQEVLDHGKHGVIKSIIFDDSNNIIVGSGDGNINTYSRTQTGWKFERCVETDIEICNAVGVDSNEKFIYSGSRDQSLRCFDRQTGLQVNSGVVHTRGIKALNIGRTGNYILTGSYDRTAILWDAISLQPVNAPIRCGNSGVSSVKLTEDSIILCTFDGHVGSWTLDGRLRWLRDSIDHDNEV